MPSIAFKSKINVDSSLYRFTVDTYHSIINTGIFKNNHRVELIDGILHTMSPISSYHSGKSIRLMNLLFKTIGNLAIISVQNPLTIPEHSEPQPDLMLLRPRDDFYEHAHPLPTDTLLIIEIAESSLRYDRTVKVPLYGLHGVPELWLIDLKQKKIELYRDPGTEGYRQILLPERHQIIAPVLLPPVQIKVADLWS